jgi:hypothetical protein
VPLASALCGVLGLALSASVAGSSTPPAATAAQVSKLVVAAAKITTLSAAVSAELPHSSTDFSWSDYPQITPEVASDCLTVTACVYGDTSSSKVIVLYGDSHALMWLPAIAPVASADKFKLVLLWVGLCPAATLSVYFPTFDYPSACNTDRSQFISDIKGLDPVAVVIGERTTQINRTATAFVTSAQWKAGLETTIDHIKSRTTKVIVLEDTPFFDAGGPVCLSEHPSRVRSCAIPFPNPEAPGLQSAEQAAARATSSLYVKTQGWFCTKTCSAVIGNFIPFIDTQHISFAYAQYLDGVMGNALKPDL